MHVTSDNEHRGGLQATKEPGQIPNRPSPSVLMMLRTPSAAGRADPGVWEELPANRGLFTTQGEFWTNPFAALQIFEA